MTESIENGTIKLIDGKKVVFYDGYWIRHYDPPPDTLTAKRRLILGLTKRTFHHTETGINTPGKKLEEARAAYERETETSRKRVNAAMLAGALFNRAAEIFTTLVDLESKGVDVGMDNELMQQCGNYLTEALHLGRLVKHFSGHEGLDELWGEPLKVFTMPVEDFYVSRYIKIAQSMKNIDDLASAIISVFGKSRAYSGVEEIVTRYATAAKQECETMKSDSVIFSIWPEFVAAREALEDFRPATRAYSKLEAYSVTRELEVIKEGKNLISYVAGARVPMPKSTREYLAMCDSVKHQIAA